MKFLADMGISPITVQFLRELGHDASHLHEQGLRRMEDADILVKARDEGRIVLTADLGFGDLLAASREVLPSVVSFRLGDMRPDNVNIHLRALLLRAADELTTGAMVSVTERRYRVRKLPIR